MMAPMGIGTTLVADEVRKRTHLRLFDIFVLKDIFHFRTFFHLFHSFSTNCNNAIVVVTSQSLRLLDKGNCYKKNRIE